MCLFGIRAGYSFFVWIALFLFFGELSSAADVMVSTEKVDTKSEKTKDLDLSAPMEVLVEKTTTSSVHLSWKAPPSPKGPNLKLFTYSLTLTPLTQYGHGLEKEFSLPPTITSKQVEGLLEGTRYAVQLSAIYGDPTKALSHDALVRVAAPKFTVLVPHEVQLDIPVGDDGIPKDEPPCNCSDAGMVACTRRPGFVECACQPGYAGTWCEKCAAGNFRAGKECRICPCSNLTSTAECKMESSGQVSCVQCLPGHRGSLCSSCAAGYQWLEDEERCAPLDCLSSSLCVEQRNAPGCEGCVFLENRNPATAHRSKSDRSIADGTLPLIAVIVTLGVLLLVAAMATCWRYWDHRRHQPRVPFWSIEPQHQHDEKNDLHSHCHYQHLDAVASKTGLQQQSTDQIGDSSIQRTYNAMNV